MTFMECFDEVFEKRFVREGEKYPRGYGVAYLADHSFGAWMYPFPINHLVGGLRSLWLRLRDHQSPYDCIAVLNNRIAQLDKRVMESDGLIADGRAWRGMIAHMEKKDKARQERLENE